MSLLRRVLLPVLAGVALYYAFFGGEYSLLELRRMEGERAREVVELEEVVVDNARLRARVDSLESDPATLERIARERYGMIGEDERLYRFADTAVAAAPDSARRR